MVNQTSWLERNWQFNFDTGLFPIVYSRLAGAIPRAERMLQNVDEKFAERKLHGWTAKEHLGHLGDLEELWWKRWEDFKNQKDVLTPADITNKRTTEANHNQRNIHDLLQTFSSERQKILDAIYDCDEVMLNRTSLHPRLKTRMRLIDYLYFVAEHDDHHLAAIMMLLS